MLIYLASPYTAPSVAEQEIRFKQTQRFVYQHLQFGRTVFSPIVYAHQFVAAFDAFADAESWKQHNDEWLIRSDCVWALRLPGWEHSAGVAYELDFATRNGIPIEYKDAT